MSFCVLLYFLKEGDPVQMLGFNRYLNAQVKYRGLKRISEFKGYTDKRSTDEKPDGIIAKIERM